MPPTLKSGSIVSKPATVARPQRKSSSVINPQDRALLRYSLVVVWLATAAASAWELHGQSQALLVAAGLSDPAWITALTLGGAMLDLILGIFLLFKPVRSSYLAALGAMLVMTAIATAFSPGLWLHPLGPLLKNIPIAVALWILAGAQQ